MIVNRLEANKERFRREGFDRIRPHSIRSLQFDQKVRPPSFRPEKFDLFTATRVTLPLGGLQRWGIFGSNFCVSEKRDRKWIEGFEIEFFRFC